MAIDRRCTSCGHLYSEHDINGLTSPTVNGTWKRPCLKIYNTIGAPRCTCESFAFDELSVEQTKKAIASLVENERILNGLNAARNMQIYFERNWLGVEVPDPEDKQLEDDNVHHPKHYTRGKIEVWDFIIDQKLNYLRGNAVKYIAHAGDKSPDTEIEDIEKAIAYLDREKRRIIEEKN